MSYRRCAAKTCFNTQGCRPNLKFFNFPRDKEICYLWVVNSGRTDLLNKPIEQINKFMLCADHFEPHWFLNPKYKTKFIRAGHPVPTIFYNNLVDFVPKSLQKTVVQKNISTSGERSEFYNHINGVENSVQNSVHSAVDILEMLRDGDVSNESHVQLEDNTVEIKIDVDSYVDDGSTIRDCHKMCRLCACLVYEYKLISIFTADKIQNLESKISRFLPGKVLEGDGLPEHVCNSCVNKLNECDLVVQEFIAADRKLRNLFQLQNVVPTISESGTCKVHMKSPAGTTESSVFPPGLEEFLAVKDDMILNEIHQSQRNDKVHPFKESLSQEENFVVAEIEYGDSQEECDALSQVEASEMEMLQDVRLEVSGDVGDISTYVNSAQDQKVTKPYRCSICKAEYDERNKLLIHEITDHVFERKEMPMFHKKYKREQVACTICNEVFSGKKPLRRHIKEQHIPAENICEFCGAHYQIKSQLEVHRRLHTNEKPFLCETCNCSFHFKKELQRHNRANHSQVKSLTCAVCNKTCSTRNALWRHEKTHTDERNVLCYLCGKVLSNPQSLRVHLRTHSSDRPCSCPTCGKSFKDNTSVSKHMLMHSAIKNFACDICGRAFYSKALVKQHKLSHSGIKPYKCEVCGAAYNRLGNLNQHKKKHAANPMPVEDLSYECVVCGKRMRSELTLKYHLGRHTGEKKPFDCEVCGKCFVAVDPYRVHMRIHTGERPYQCTTCGKTFRSVFTLKQHSALHRDEFPYGCPYCERKFKRLQSLIVHKRTHTGEKPHICQQCGRGFAQKGDMLKHSKTHARDRHAAVSKLKEEKVVMEISELVFSDSEITNEFLIDMPIVEVETEIKTEINSGIV